MRVAAGKLVASRFDAMVAEAQQVEEDMITW